MSAERISIRKRYENSKAPHSYGVSRRQEQSPPWHRRPAGGIRRYQRFRTPSDADSQTYEHEFIRLRQIVLEQNFGDELIITIQIKDGLNTEKRWVERIITMAWKDNETWEDSVIWCSQFRDEYCWNWETIYHMWSRTTLALQFVLQQRGRFRSGETLKRISNEKHYGKHEQGRIQTRNSESVPGRLVKRSYDT